ncbi:MAG TPA: hypothetical protein VGT98_07985 [Candidatus Elarobacter sp.]|nr:hypothetical protein [Candidatus Elarobacter sp.]HEV2740457.1 hypothetical protein [Candidatus Elarobacter sp.]
MNGGTVNPSTNGSPPDPDRRVSSVGYVATASSAADRRARNEHVADLQERVEKCEESCKNARAQITAAEERQDSIPDHHRGWPLQIVAILALISVFFEYMPASLFTQVFTSATTNLQLHLLTIVFTIIGALLAVVLGELFRRTREPVRHHVRETVLFVIVGLFTLGFLTLGYELRLAFTNVSHDALLAISAPVEALALTAVAAIGIALTVVSSYFREGYEAFQVRSSLSRLRRELATNEAHLGANQRDLKRALGSAAHDGERRTAHADPAPSEGTKPV